MNEVKKVNEDPEFFSYMTKEEDEEKCRATELKEAIDAGIDIGDGATQQMLDSLIGVGGITSAEVNGVKNMANQPASRFEVLYGANKTASEQDLRDSGVI